jgi:DNA-binding XRE family transcriptional regulator
MVNTSDRIRKLRIQKGWTQQELAEASGVDLRTIQRMEAGQSVLDVHRKQPESLSCCGGAPVVMPYMNNVSRSRSKEMTE